jgi:hypothetical protein
MFQRFLFCCAILFMANDAFSQNQEIGQGGNGGDPYALSNLQPAPADAPSPQNPKRSRYRGRFGFHDNRYIYVPFEYEALPEQYSDAMIAQKNGLYGLIDGRNKVVVPFEYSNMHYQRRGPSDQEASKYLRVVKGKYQGIIDVQGRVCIPVDNIVLDIIGTRLFHVGSPESKYAIVAIDGKQMTKQRYDTPLHCLFKNVYRTAIGDRVGCIDTTGNVLVPFEYESIRTIKPNPNLVQDKYNLLVQKNKLFGVVDTFFKLTIPCRYTELNQLKSGHYVFGNGVGTGVMDARQHVLIPPQFTRIELFAQGRAYLACDTLCAIYGLDGREIYPRMFSMTQVGSAPVFFAVKQAEHRWGCFDLKGNTIHPPGFKYVKHEKNYFLVTDMSYLYAIFDSLGAQLTPFAYRSASVEVSRKKEDDKVVHVTTFKVSDSRGEWVLDATGKPLNQAPVATSAPAEKEHLGEKLKNPNLEEVFASTRWEGVFEAEGESCLVEIKLLSNKTGERKFFIPVGDNYCEVFQGLEWSILPSTSTPSLLLRFPEVSLFKPMCPDSIPIINNRGENLYKGLVYKPVFPIKNDLVVPGLERLSINDTRKRSSLDIRSSLQRFLAAQALKKSTQEQPGGFNQVEYRIDRTSNRVYVTNYGSEDYMADMAFSDDSFTLSTRQWITDSKNYVPAAVLRQVRYIGPDGKAKTGDLDVVFDATTTNRFWFHER